MTYGVTGCREEVAVDSITTSRLNGFVISSLVASFLVHMN